MHAFGRGTDPGDRCTHDQGLRTGRRGGRAGNDPVLLPQRGLGLVGHVVLDFAQRLLVDPLIGLGRRVHFQTGEGHGVIGIRVE
ncbi:hypothetical protein D9M71_645730 [compost metagenome]